MDGFRVGDRVRELPNSTRYGAKRWKLEVDQDGKRTWVELEMTQEEKDFDRLESTLLWANHPTWARSAPVTQADIDKYNLPAEYLDGHAIFPKVENINESTPEGRARAAKQEADWQESALRLHENQQPLPRLAEKPSDDSTKGLYFSELKRSD